MKNLLFLSVCLILSIQTNAQNLFTASFVAENNFFKNSKSIELKDVDNNVVLTYNTDGLSFDNQNYVVNKDKNSIIVSNSSTKENLGVIKKNFRSFTFDNNSFKLSKKGRGNYNFTIKDNENNIVAFAKYELIRDEIKIEINNGNNANILPFVFLITLNEINNYRESLNLMIFTILLGV